jgi:outer membrane receptor protein involved in Fe transport
MESRRFALSVTAMLVGLAGPALADDTTVRLAEGDAGTPSDTVTMGDLDIVAQRLDIARQQIQPSLGATRYDFGPEALQTIPQGQNAPLNQVLLQAPGVAEDSFGQIHVRGEHANVQFRINGVQLPEGLSVFGQALESRFARSISLITGALPAQYGFQTAGVVDIQTKTGTSNPGLALTAYGGSFSWAQPSFEYGGRSGPIDYFITGDYLHNNRGIENPAFNYSAIHDTTNQFHGLAYVSGIIDPDTRISLILGGFNGQFQIPNNPGQTPPLGLSVNGITDFDSSKLNEFQREITDFGVLSLQKHIDDVDFQLSAFSRYSSLYFSPDWTGDLLFNGIAQQASKQIWSSGVQDDTSWRINDRHTLRAGFLVQADHLSTTTNSQVLPVDPTTGLQTSDQPITIGQGTDNTGVLYGFYLQDEWRVLPAVTVNYGARFDVVNEFTQEHQLSPRLNVVWRPTSTTTLTAGYSRYFVPPPFEVLSTETINSFANTTAAPAVTQNDTVKAERSNYYDAGISQIVVPGLTLGFDAYYKESKNLIDEGQFGAPIIFTAFNYAHGQQAGGQLTASYDKGPWSLYGNLAYSRAIGKDIVSAQFNFMPDELAYISQHWIHLDHDQRWTSSGGAAYTFWRGSTHPLLLSADFTVQSGLRASTATVPNGVALPTYGYVNLSVVQKVNLWSRGPTEFRFDVLNAGDVIYHIRNGTGVGVGAPQYGIRRAFLGGVTQRF